MADLNQLAEIDELRLRLDEAEATIRAIRSGAVDAFVVEEPHGTRVYTLQSADRPYRLLVEEMQQGAVTLSDDGTLAYCNRRFADLVGKPLERLMGVAFRDFIPLDAQGSYESLLQQGRTGFSQGESHVRNAEGALVPVFLTFNALPPDSGAAVGLLVTDLTTQRHHEKLNALLEALKASDRSKDEFLAMLSHELRSPLAPIANAVQLLGLQRESENLIQQQARGIIERQMAHLQRLVADLLEVSRITTGRVQLRREPVAVSSIVEGAVETSRPLLEQRRHELTVSLPPEPIRLYADAARLEQVVANLLTNAAKFTEEGGHVWLTVRHEGDECVLRVRDTGVGIAPALLPGIFDLFTQAERSLDRAQGGLGIGLALVQRLTDLHGGSVEASSVLGRGSEFIVRLPVAPADAPQSQPLSPVPDISRPIARPLRVLVVDDNVDTVLSFQMLLTASGHDVRTAQDGPTAVQVALDYRPDVVLLDIGLPGLNGYEVANRIRQQPVLKNVVLVALTGYGQDSDRETSLQAGFNHHLVKPARLEQVQQILATVVGGK